MTNRCARGINLPRPILAVILRARKMAAILSESAARQASRRTCILSFAALLAFTACHSYHIDSTIENRTGAPVQLLEVDYPSASFGADVIASGAVYRYRFVVHGSGPLKLSYMAANGRQVQIAGPTLAEPVQGQLRIVLLPGGKAQFLPRFTPQR
jgi:hypothetical protein